MTKLNLQKVIKIGSLKKEKLFGLIKSGRVGTMGRY